MKRRHHMSNMEELLNQVSAKITRDRTAQLFISKINLDYAYGQMQISEETSRRYVIKKDILRRLLDVLHVGHSGVTTMTAEEKRFWWPEIQKDIEQKVKCCTASLATGKNLKYYRPK